MWNFAFSTLCGIFSRFSIRLSNSEASTLTRADQDRLRLRVALLDLVDDRVVFFAARLVDAIVRVFARDRPVGRDDVDVELVDVVKLGRFGFGGAGHAGELCDRAGNNSES